MAIIIVVLQLVYFFVVPITIGISSDEKTDLNSDEIIKFQQKIDSLKTIEIENRKPKLFPFNPSFITDFKGYQLGMSIDEIDRLLAHRAKGKYINSATEFQQITQVSDSLLAIISPYFKFPDWVEKRQQKSKTTIKTYKPNQSKNYTVQDLNSAIPKDLTIINGIGDKLAQRIINYRNKLGGFAVDSQLYEVYYLDKAVADNVLQRFKVLKSPPIQKINLNEASFKEVLSIVYIDYDLTKKIFAYRDEVAEIQSLEELKKIEGFPIEKFDRIALYLEAK